MPKRPEGLIDEALTSSIIGAFYEVYNTLGPGFLEHVYSLAMERELIARGHRVAREYSAIIYYKGTELTRQRLDMVVDEKVVLELKATEVLDKVGPRQLLSYLRASSLEVGLLLHFGPEAKFYRVAASNLAKPRRRPRPRPARNDRDGLSQG